MKTPHLRSLIVGTLLLIAATHTWGNTINGTLHVGGYMIADSSDLSSATFFKPFDFALNRGDGDFSSAFPEYGGRLLGMDRIYLDNPAESSWEFGNNATLVYQFLFTSFDTLIIDEGIFHATGTGIAKITGFEDTFGAWSISGSQDRFALWSQATFTATGIPVSEHGSSLLLLSLGLAIVAWGRRFRKH